jgi:hypothetical protein
MSTEETEAETINITTDALDFANRLGSLIMASAHTFSLGLEREDAEDIIEGTVIAFVDSLIDESEPTEDTAPVTEAEPIGYVIRNKLSGSTQEISGKIFNSDAEANEYAKKYATFPSRYEAAPVYVGAR